MVEYIELITNLGVALVLSIVLAGIIWIIKFQRERQKDKNLFIGTLWGGIQVFTIYFFVIPLLDFIALSKEWHSFLSTLFIGLVFILGVELFSYVLTHLIKAHREVLALGLIGGITRSEAVTGSMVDLVKDNPKMMENAVCVILTANAVMLARNLILVLLIPAIGFSLFSKIFLPMGAMLLLSVILIYTSYKKGEGDVELKPISFMSALQIVLAFSILTVLFEFASSYGEVGYYTVAAIGGFAGALPVIFSAIAITGYKTLSITILGNIILIASALACINDTLIAIIFKQKELFKKLVLKELLVVLAGIVAFFALLSPKK